MTAVFVANGTAFGAWAGSIPWLRDARRLDEASLGIVLLCISLGAVGAMQVAGRYAARMGLVRACWVGTLVLGAALPWPVLAQGWWALLGAAVLLGFAMGWLDVCMNAHAAGLERRWGTAIMSSFHAGWSLGQLVGSALVGVLAGAGVRLLPSLIVAGVVAGCGLWALRLSPGGEAPERVRFAWPSLAMLALCAVIGASFAIEGAVADWSGVFLRAELGASTATATTALAVFAGTMVVFRLVGDRLVRMLGPVRVVVWGGVVAALGLVVAIAAPWVALASVGFGLVGFGVANIVPVVFSAAGRAGAAGVAMVSTAGYGAMMAAPPLIGFVSNEWGLRAGLAVMAAGCVGMAALGRRVG